MRIISRKRDYYDHVQSYGLDPTIVYDRVSREDVSRAEIPEHVCRSMRPVEVFLKESAGRRRRRGTPDIMGFYSLIGGIVRSIWYERPSPDVKWEDFDKDRFRVYDSKEQALHGRKEIGYSFFLTGNDRPKDGSDVFMDCAKEVESPVIVFSYPGSDITQKNVYMDWPILGDMGYGKIIPATQIYSDIYNFLLSIKEKPMIEISDMDKIRKAGLDVRQSFRHRK